MLVDLRNKNKTLMKTKKNHLIILTLGLSLLLSYVPQASAQKVAVTVEEMPEYPGGVTAMQEFIKENLKYPVDAQEKKIEGRVVVRFIVGEDGNLRQPVINRGLSPSCDAEVIRIIQAMPKWKPGKQNGKNVDVYFNLPVHFKLPKTKK